MSGFDDRKKGQESKFAHDQEMEFKISVRRNKLLGAWAAELMGKTGEEAEVYTKEVIISDMEEKGDEDVFRKIRGDLDAQSIEMSDHRIRRQMEELMSVAREQILSGK
ncbi:DUF1476 domain-containing protein [Sneathiella sp. CAU 1612]|uniref:DUF1476 domain-containing protein n=1 Tax=Sneathiella sedimenti TaxID=2816034 RepID=A0ABS3F8P0_9PROT|nr:DUF1476 domain-containing protein [Sneathiella sedimenti]MBO0334879.1 DUF1476 domain-containing protein [Sneathiella sedimenti]